MMDAWLLSLSRLLRSSGWIAPVLAMVGGLLTSVTPCALSTMPLIIGFVGGTGQKEPGRAFRLSLTFALGSAVTFTVLGVLASAAGRMVSNAGSWWYLLLGTVMVLMALQTWELVTIIPATYLTSKNTRRGYWGAFAAGILGGVFSSPCATPILVVLLGILAEGGNPAWGALLMLCYALGCSVLTVAAGTWVGLVRKIISDERYRKFSLVLKIFLGAVMLLLGFYLFYLGF